MDDSRKFYVLDAMRGIAALAVVQLHTSQLFGAQYFHHAGLAVDFFFMLSGFVLRFAYQTKLDAGWSTKDFLKTRLIRLYPLYFLSIILGALYWFLHVRFGHHSADATNLGLFFVIGLAMLPSLPGTANAGGFAFPLNIPTWSLFYEIIANIFHATLLRRRSTTFLLIVAFLSALIFVLTVVHVGSVECGFRETDIYYGISRVIFGYTAGILIFMLWKKARFQRRVSPFIPAALLVAMLVGPNGNALSYWYDLGCIIVVFPAVLLLGAYSTPPAWLLPTTHWMGVTSYALYVLHTPIAAFYGLLWSRLTHHEIEDAAPWGGILFIVLTLALVVVIDAFYDLPVRSYLRRKLARV